MLSSPANSGILTALTNKVSATTTLPNRIFSSKGNNTIGEAAINNGERLENAETKRNQPINGDSQSGKASNNTRVAVQLSIKGTAAQIRCHALPPRKSIQMLTLSNTRRWVAIMMTKVTSGMTITAVRSFDRTVSKSVHGIERQKRILRSFLSA